MSIALGSDNFRHTDRGADGAVPILLRGDGARCVVGERG